MAAKPPVWPVVNGLPVSRVVTQAQVDVVKEMQFYPEDLWIASYPKAGTTWTQQIVKLIHTRGEDNGKKVDQSVPWIEAMNNPDPAFDYRVDLSILKHPRAFKSHFTYELMPCGEPSSSHCKFIYVARNPKDTAVSYFYHYQGFKYVPTGVEMGGLYFVVYRWRYGLRGLLRSRFKLVDSKRRRKYSVSKIRRHEKRLVWLYSRNIVFHEYRTRLGSRGKNSRESVFFAT